LGIVVCWVEWIRNWDWWDG